MTGAAGMQGPPGPQGAAGPAGTPGTLYGERGSRFAGFTTATTTGNHGGREAMHATCAAQFAGSHLCHFSEFELSQSTTPPPASGAWLDPSCEDNTDNLGNLTLVCNISQEALPESGRMIFAESSPYDQNCTNWTNATNQASGLSIQPAGGVTAPCNTALPLACCGTPYYETFRGFTTATTAGNSGGRASMHGLCAAQYPGSHLCHVAEYHRANPSAPPPAAGAWLDGSSVGNYGFITNATAQAKAGRFTGVDSTYNRDNCKNWTSNLNANQGWVVQPAGTNTATCDQALPAACCGG